MRNNRGYPFIMPRLTEDPHEVCLAVSLNGSNDVLLQVRLVSLPDRVRVELGEAVGKVEAIVPPDLLTDEMRMALDEDNARLRRQNDEMVRILRAQRVRAEAAEREVRRLRKDASSRMAAD